MVIRHLHDIHHTLYVLMFLQPLLALHRKVYLPWLFISACTVCVCAWDPRLPNLSAFRSSLFFSHQEGRAVVTPTQCRVL
jgi:hypothetical protein